MKPFKTGLIVGRFQPIHVGHEKLIQIGTTLCEKLVIFVSSSDKLDNNRNPLPIEYRLTLVKTIYEQQIQQGSVIVFPLADLTNENDLTPLWGEYVIKHCEEQIQQPLECIIYGKDKNIHACFSKESVAKITEVFVDRLTLDISATKLREYSRQDNKEAWMEYINPKLHGEYDTIRQNLMKVEVPSHDII